MPETLKDYLTRECELAKHAALCAAQGETPAPLGWLSQIHWLAAGDDDLFGIMWSFCNFSHAMDDLLDGSGWPADQIEAAMAALHDVTVAYLRRDDTQPAMVAFLKVWHALLDVNRWPIEDCRLANKAMSDFFMDLARNPVATRYNRELETALVQCLVRNLDGDAMAQSPDASVRVLAPAVRCGDVDVLMHMVYLRRGWTGLRAVSGFRQYDIEDKPETRNLKLETAEPVAVKMISSESASNTETTLSDMLLGLGKSQQTQEAN